MASRAPTIKTGFKLCTRRRAIGLSRKVLGELAGLSYTQMSWIERGLRPPSRAENSALNRAIRYYEIAYKAALQDHLRGDLADECEAG